MRNIPLQDVINAPVVEKWISHCDVDGLNCIIGTHQTHRVLQILWTIQQSLLAEMTRHIIRRSRSVKPKLTVANVYMSQLTRTLVGQKDQRTNEWSNLRVDKISTVSWRVKDKKTTRKRWRQVGKWRGWQHRHSCKQTWVVITNNYEGEEVVGWVNGRDRWHGR